MNAKRILEMSNDPRLDALIEPFEVVTSVVMGAHGVELDELLAQAMRVGFVCGLLMGGDPLRVLELRE